LNKRRAAGAFSRDAASLGDIAECWADPSKAAQELGWKASRDLAADDDRYLALAIEPPQWLSQVALTFVLVLNCYIRGDVKYRREN
jgi:hypothetical protein